MNENILVLVVSIVLIVGITCTIIYQRWGKIIPKESFVGFNSLREIAYYYKSSIDIVSQKRWLLWLPLCFLLAGYLLMRLPSMISNMKMLASFKNMYTPY